MSSVACTARAWAVATAGPASTAVGTIAGGFSNYINGYAATVAGGWDQNAYEAYSCVSVSLHIVSPVDGWSLIAVRCLVEFTGSLAEEPLETLMLTLQQLPVVNQMQSRVRGVALVEVSATLPVRTQARSVAVALEFAACGNHPDETMRE